MNPKKYNIAQLNIARLIEPLTSPKSKDFADGLEPINALAEKSPGFVWRLKDDEGTAGATSYRPFDDDMIVVNMSVWDSIESLRAFAFSSEHVEYLKRRAEWFSRIKEAYAVMWWVEVGHRPTIAEAIARLKFLRSKGDTEKAFSFRNIFQAPES